MKQEFQKKRLTGELFAEKLVFLESLRRVYYDSPSNTSWKHAKFLLWWLMKKQMNA